jgi:hypothetical protein
MITLRLIIVQNAGSLPPLQRDATWNRWTASRA